MTQAIAVAAGFWLHRRMGNARTRPSFIEFPPRRNDPGRRWFHAASADLILWPAADGSIGGFQFCYQHDDREHALTWKQGYGFSHMAVDSGRGRAASPGTPLLVPNGRFDVDLILESFRAPAATLPAGLADFVAGKIGEARASGR